MVREWLSTQSYEQQRAFGLKILRDFGGHPMRKPQMRNSSDERLVEEFRRLSAEHGHALETGNPRSANRRYDTLVAIRHELRSRGPEAQRQLLKLLADPEPSTRCWTASFLLQLAPREAEQVLEELVRTQRNTIGVTARITLEQWREGTFHPP